MVETGNASLLFPTTQQQVIDQMEPGCTEIYVERMKRKINCSRAGGEIRWERSNAAVGWQVVEASSSEIPRG